MKIFTFITPQKKLYMVSGLVEKTHNDRKAINKKPDKNLCFNGQMGRQRINNNNNQAFSS
jgi:hypothetical protein